MTAKTPQRADTLGFGARLRAARQAAGLTLREVAEPSGISLNYLSDLERGVVSNPALDKLRALALTLDVSIDELLGISRGRSEPDLPDALRDFLAGPDFAAAVDAEAKRWRVDPTVLRKGWATALGGITVQGKAPRRASDYFFVFEAARRAVEEA